MAHTDDLVYAYDGTYDGMLCCVWAAFFYKENPCEIWPFEEEQPTLYRLRQVDTAAEPAQRVQNGIRARLGTRAEQWVLDAWYSALPRRELAILEFLKLGFAKGPCVTAMPGHPQVAPLYAASRALHNEAHLLTGFLRFTDYGGTLVARIRPKNQVLPFLEPHFSARFPRERYLFMMRLTIARWPPQAEKAVWPVWTACSCPPPTAARPIFRPCGSSFTTPSKFRHGTIPAAA